MKTANKKQWVSMKRVILAAALAGLPLTTLAFGFSSGYLRGTTDVIGGRAAVTPSDSTPLPNPPIEAEAPPEVV